MRNSLIATLIASVFWTPRVMAADLLQIYRDALTNDPVYASARAAMVAGEEKIPQGRSGLFPALSVNGSYLSNGLEYTPSQPDPANNVVNTSTHYPTESYTVSLTQPLFRMTNWQQYQIGILSAAGTEAAFSQAQEDLILRVAQAYFDVLSAQDALTTIQANKTAIAEQLESAKRNFEVGTSTITDTNEAQSRYDLAIAQELAAQNELEIKRSSLQQIIGKAPGDLASLRTGVQLTPPEPAIMDKWIDSAENENFNVVGQNINVEIAKRTTKSNRAGHYPTLDFTATRTHTNQGGYNILYQPGINNETAVGIQWTLPVFSGFMVNSKVKESIALEEKASDDLENAKRTAAQAARQAYLGVHNGLAQISAYEAAEVSSKSSMDSNQLGYQVGIRINIDVLNAQQQLYNTRQTLAKARYDTILNGLRLKSAAGSLKEDDLVTINSLLTHGIDPGAQQPAATTSTDGNADTASNVAMTPVSAKTDVNAATTPEQAEVLHTIQKWADAWSTRDVKSYLSFYSTDFRPANGLSHEDWASQRSARITSKKDIRVEIEAPQISLSGGKATATFHQVYHAGNIKEVNKKTLQLAKRGDEWRIVKESAGN